MYTIELISYTGVVSVYSSKKEVYQKLGLNFLVNQVAFEIAEKKKEYHWKDYYVKKDTDLFKAVLPKDNQLAIGDFILRDSNNNILTVEDFFEYITISHYVGKVKRGESVRGVHRLRTGHYFRKPRTYNEIKKSFVVKEEGEVEPRKKRSFRKIPTDRHDIHVASRCDRSWKNYRKNQYK